jgi:hypothetical protein
MLLENDEDITCMAGAEIVGATIWLNFGVLWLFLGSLSLLLSRQQWQNHARLLQSFGAHTRFLD